MTEVLFAIVWWYGLIAVATTVGLLLAGAFFTVREAVWDRDRRRRIAVLSLEEAWALPAREPQR